MAGQRLFVFLYYSRARKYFLCFVLLFFFENFNGVLLRRDGDFGF